MLVRGRCIGSWGGGRQGAEEGSGRKCLNQNMVPKPQKGRESSRD